MTVQIDQQRLAQDIVEQARAEGIQLVGADGLLTGLTKNVLETALEAELCEHPGHDQSDAAGRNGANSRNGTRTKTVITALWLVRSRYPAIGRQLRADDRAQEAAPPGRHR